MISVQRSMSSIRCLTLRVLRDRSTSTARIRAISSLLFSIKSMVKASRPRRYSWRWPRTARSASLNLPYMRLVMVMCIQALLLVVGGGLEGVMCHHLRGQLAAEDVDCSWRPLPDLGAVEVEEDAR